MNEFHAYVQYAQKIYKDKLLGEDHAQKLVSSIGGVQYVPTTFLPGPQALSVLRVTPAYVADGRIWTRNQRKRGGTPSSHVRQSPSPQPTWAEITTCPPPLPFFLLFSIEGAWELMGGRKVDGNKRKKEWEESKLTSKGKENWNGNNEFSKRRSTHENEWTAGEKKARVKFNLFTQLGVEFLGVIWL